MTGAWPRETANRRFTPVADALQGYLERTGLAESLERLGAVEEWAGAVGRRVSRVTRADDRRRSFQIGKPASSSWTANQGV